MNTALAGLNGTGTIVVATVAGRGGSGLKGSRCQHRGTAAPSTHGWTSQHRLWARRCCQVSASSADNLPPLEFHPQEPQVDVFKVLGVSKGASADEIKSAFRQKAKELHPDVNPESTAHEQFMALQEAYKILVNEWKMVLERAPGLDTAEHKTYNEKINKEMLEMFNRSFTDPF